MTDRANSALGSEAIFLQPGLEFYDRNAVRISIQSHLSYEKIGPSLFSIDGPIFLNLVVVNSVEC